MIKPIHSRLRRTLSALLVSALVGGGLCPAMSAQENSAWLLKTNAAVTSAGVFLADVVIPPTGVKAPHVRIADAPAFGSSVSFQPEQLNPLIAKATQLNPGTNWLGAPQIVISRRARPLTEFDVQQMLTEKLSADYLSQGGELELRLTRTWNEVPVPDEPFAVKIQ